jgi:hypothetical protein
MKNKETFKYDFMCMYTKWTGKTLTLAEEQTFFKRFRNGESDAEELDLGLQITSQMLREGYSKDIIDHFRPNPDIIINEILDNLEARVLMLEQAFPMFLEILRKNNISLESVAHEEKTTVEQSNNPDNLS